ncbi:MAG: hypothetical protein ACRDUW_29625, partial [Pseudonocardiaceae bacterium]
ATGAKPGPKPRGERVPTPVYLPVELRVAVEEIAEQDGLPLTAVVTRFVAECLGKSPPSYCLPKATLHNQTELPLDKAS